MNTTVFVADLYARGLAIEPADAIAIVRSFVEGVAVSASADTAAPASALQRHNLELRADGSVVCAGYDATPTVAEVAILLEALIPQGTPRVPGGVRYAIARALHDVDAPPFDSLEEFAQALSRYARTDPREAVRTIIARAATPPWIGAGRPQVVAVDPQMPARVVPPPASKAEASDGTAVQEERRTAPELAGIRRQLREGDRRAYEEFTAAIAERHRPAVAKGRGTQRHSVMPYAAAALVAMALVLGAYGRQPHHRPSASTAQANPGALPGDREPARPAAPPPQAAAERAQAHGALPDVAPARVTAPDTTIPPRATGDAAGRLVPALDNRQRPIFSPAFASNGSAMFFHTGGNRDPSSALMASSDDGLRVMTIVDDGARNYHVQPSPDGSQVAFDSDRDGERGVYVADRDGSHVTRVSGSGYAAVPTWSPDGRSLAFVRAEPDNPRVWNLWRLWLDSREMERLTAYPYGQTWSASWFHDGRRICYTHEDQVIVRDMQSGRTRVFPTPLKGHLVRTPAVSPDGTKIIFQVHGSGAWLLDLADGSTRLVLNDPTAEEFAWTPDGRRVAFHSRRDGDWGIWVMAPG